jgi:hypothetical protein
VTRFAALRLQLWLRGHELPPSRIKEDLKSEFERLLKRYLGTQPPIPSKSDSVTSANFRPLISKQQD